MAGSLLFASACIGPDAQPSGQDAAPSPDSGPVESLDIDAEADAGSQSATDAAMFDASRSVRYVTDAGARDGEAEPGGDTDAQAASEGADAGPVDTEPDAGAVEQEETGFSIHGQVVGDFGQGLSISLNDGAPQPVSAASFRFSGTFNPGERFAAQVATQPTAPAALCRIVNAEGLIEDRDVTLEVRCTPLGGLRISEIGSCYYYDSACWFELYNAGGQSEELSEYEVRAPAAQGAPPYAVSRSKTFALPSHALGPGQYAVIAARSSHATPDGGGLFHIAAESYLPWWNDSGFIELVSQGETADFVRFGDDDQEPLTSGSYSENAPALSSGPLAYGFSLARDADQTDANRGADFALRAFATPHGPNDVTSSVDADGDGIPDSAETPGGRFAGLDVYAMGARGGVRDLFVEVDRMDSEDPGLTPLRAALDKLVQAFADDGFALHLDVGPLFSADFDPAAHNLGGGEVVPFAKAVGFSPSDEQVADFHTYKAQFMAVERRSFFYYMLFAYSQQADGTPGSAGIGEVYGNDTIITLGGYGLSTRTTRRENLVANYQASTMMHELGHNLNLRHGGDENTNYKPNYVSVMNYLYGSLGLPIIGSDEGDRYDLTTGCSLRFVTELNAPPTESPVDFRLSFSHGESGDIDERSVWESEGLGHAQSAAVDFNCNGETDAPYAADLNFDGVQGVLRDFDDWNNLQLVFSRSAASNDNAKDLFAKRRLRRPVSVHLEDHQPVADVPCPPLALRTQ